MKSNNSFSLASIYIGTVIGAGFASGQELMKFFCIYGYKGIFGVLLSGLLFSLIGIIVLLKVYKDKVNGFNEFISPIFGMKISYLIDILVTIYLFAGFIIMLSGSGAVFYENIKIEYNTGIYIMASLTFITFLFRIKGISTINNFLVPLLIIGIVGISAVTLYDSGFTFSNYYGVKLSKTGNWVTSSILYVSYNSLTVIVVMTSILKLIKSKSQAIKGGILAGLVLSFMALMITITLLIFYSEIESIEIPMLRISIKLSKFGYISYSVILILAMFTTAVSHGFGFINRFKNYFKVNDKLVAIIFVLSSIPLSKFGFSKLVYTIYPIFGYLGLFILIGIILSTIKTIILNK